MLFFQLRVGGGEARGFVLRILQGTLLAEGAGQVTHDGEEDIHLFLGARGGLLLGVHLFLHPADGLAGQRGVLFHPPPKPQAREAKTAKHEEPASEDGEDAPARAADFPPHCGQLAGGLAAGGEEFADGGEGAVERGGGADDAVELGVHAVEARGLLGGEGAHLGEDGAELGGEGVVPLPGVRLDALGEGGELGLEAGEVVGDPVEAGDDVALDEEGELVAGGGRG